MGIGRIVRASIVKWASFDIDDLWLLSINSWDFASDINCMSSFVVYTVYLCGFNLLFCV